MTPEPNELRDAAMVCLDAKQSTDVDERERVILQQASDILNSLAYLLDPAR
jgi:hypothetical protein